MIDANEFNNMTNRQKYDLLKSKKIEIMAVDFINLSAKIGDDDAIASHYQARIENIALTPWAETKDGLLEKATELIENLIKE